MRFIRTEKQKESVAKYAWDASKIFLAVMVIGPVARPESFNAWIFLGGIFASAGLGILGLVLDGKEIKL